jgi:MraZ protein
MLQGEYTHTIDAKGRLIVPAKLRESLGDKFTITRGFDGCIYAYADNEWEALKDRISKLPLNDARARSLTRFFIGGASEVEVDKQGRILVSPTLRSHAGLVKDVVSLGVGNKVEIWSLEKYNEVNAQSFENIENVAESMLEFGFTI